MKFNKLYILPMLLLMAFGCDNASITTSTYVEYIYNYNDAPTLDKISLRDISVSSTADTVSLSWQLIEYAAQYEVSRSTSENTSDIIESKTVSETSSTFSDLSVDTEYYFFIRAMSNGSATEQGKLNYSPYSDCVKVKTSDKPILYAETAGDNAVTLRWEWTDSSKVEIYQGDTSSDISKASMVKTVTDASVRSAQIEDLTLGKTYCFWVKTDGSYTSECCELMMRLPAVQGVRTEFAGSDSVSVTWNALSGADYYRVFYCKSDTTDDAYIESDKTQATVQGLKYDETYDICVSAMKNGCETVGVKSDIAKAHIVWPAVTGLKAEAVSWELKNSSSSSEQSYYVTYKVSWDKPDVSADIGYKIIHGGVSSYLSWYYSDKVYGNSTFIKTSSYIYDANTTSSAYSSSNYCFKVRMSDFLGHDGIESDLLTVSFSRPKKVNSLSAVMQDDKTSVRLAWECVSDADSYRVYCGDEIVGTVTDAKISDPTADENSLVVSNLVYSQSYTFSIETVDKNGIYSDKSDITVCMRDSVKNIKIYKTDITTYSSSPRFNYTLKWDALTDAAEYKVLYRKQGNTGWNSRTVTETNWSLRPAVSTVYADDIYEFKVAAVYEDETEAESAIMTADAPKTLCGLTGKRTDSTVTLSWPAVENVSQYYIYEMKSSGLSSSSSYNTRVFDTGEDNYSVSISSSSSVKYFIICHDENDFVSDRSEIIEVAAE